MLEPLSRNTLEMTQMPACFPANGRAREQEDEKRAARWSEHLFSNDDSCFANYLFVKRFVVPREAFISVAATENFCI